MENHFYLEASITEGETARVIKTSTYREYVQASQILLKAQATAKEIFAAARQTYADQKKKGYEAGYEDGKGEIARNITEAGLKLSLYKEKLDEKIVDTVVAVLRNVLEDIGEENVLRQIVQKALKSHRNQKEITIRVCPAQKRIVQHAVEAFQKIAEVNDFIEIQEDSTLAGGRCMLQTESTFVDIGLDVQLQMIKALLLEHISRLKRR